ncbi:hypothetical protein [Streptomyces sp. ML-6]|uniref:hypothetical protein n=1 Tax=Streptomyces sp. ML-6 TaxID=2982693 RepID=UPI0024BFFFF1|nr:hypothetical protein [Streptomyces sp. ML-6]MDK0518273.1 hypothetical protein [Streptomyces sp. ML-6]
MGSCAGPAGEVRAALADVLRGGEPVMKVAALHAWARLDRDAPVRRADVLVEALTDPGVRPRFAEIWWEQGVEDPFSREDVVRGTGRLFDHVPQAAAAFVVRLAGAADRTGDTVLRRAVLNEAWRVLVRRPSAASALLPVAGGLSADPDDTVRLKAASLLAVLGRRAAPYADRLRHIMENTDGWRRIQAARALWAATGEPEPSVQVLEEFVLAVADGDDGYGTFDEALRALVRIGTVTPASRTALRTLRERDGRLSPYGDYRAFLQNEKLRGMIEEALALP